MMTTLLYKVLLKRRHASNQGFTLIEVLAVVVLIGILSAIVAPSWVAFNDRQKLTAARNDIYSALSEASSTAKRDRVMTQLSIIENTSTGQLYWATSRADMATTNNQFIPIQLPTTANLTSANAATRREASLWKPIDRLVRIDNTSITSGSVTINRTTFAGATYSTTTPNFRAWRIQFTDKGLPFETTDSVGLTPVFPKRVTFTLQNRRAINATIAANAPRACVSLTTMLGGLQSGRNQDCQI